MIGFESLNKQRCEVILPLLCELYPSIAQEVLLQRVYKVIVTDWQCEILKEEEEIIALSGYRIMDRLCYGKFMYIDHFIVDQAYRDSSTSAHILDHLIEIAKAEDCESIILDTFVTNSKAQRLWLNNDFNIVGFHFQRLLEN